MSAAIIGTGTHLPDRIVTNEALAPLLDLDPAQIFKSSGIRARHWVPEKATTSSLAAEALDNALKDAAVAVEQIDYLILGTMTPDRFVPGSAPAVQNALKLAEIPCLDIRAACCNTLYGLQLARSLVDSGTANCVALCFAELQSPFLDLSPQAGTLSMLFGDGASALIIAGADSVAPAQTRKGLALQVVDVLLQTNGQYVDDLGIRCPGTEFGNVNTHPVTENGKDYAPKMNGQSVILQASRRMVAACKALLESNDLLPNDVRWIVPHQANANLLSQVARGLGLSANDDRVISVLAESGNTSSASMGIALDTLRRSNHLALGDLVLLPAFAAGFTWGAGLCRAVNQLTGVTIERP